MLPIKAKGQILLTDHVQSASMKGVCDAAWQGSDYWRKPSLAQPNAKPDKWVAFPEDFSCLPLCLESWYLSVCINAYILLTRHMHHCNAVVTSVYDVCSIWTHDLYNVILQSCNNWIIQTPMLPLCTPLHHVSIERRNTNAPVTRKRQGTHCTCETNSAFHKHRTHDGLLDVQYLVCSSIQLIARFHMASCVHLPLSSS